MSEGAEESITIHFSLTSSPSAPRITETIKKDAKATELRTVAAEATHIPIASLKLIFRGRIIQNDDKGISEYTVENDCVIHCLGKPVKPDTSKSTSASTLSSSVTSTATVSTTPSAQTNISGTEESSKLTLDVALKALKSKNDTATYSTALTTLGKVVSNIISNPNEEKYRKVKQSNAAFARRLGNVQGGRDAMLAVGFVSDTPEGTEEPHFVLNANADAWNHLLQSKTKIDTEIDQHKRSQYVPPPTTTTTPSSSPPFMPSPGAFGGSGGMPGMPPMTPAMQQQMSTLMSNPEMVQNLFNNPMIQQAMSDPNIINQMTQGMDPMMRQRMQQMMSDPTMRQQMQQMMSNPAMVQMMMNQMGGMGRMGSNNMGTSPPPTTSSPDPAAFARMMQGFSQMQNANNNNSSQQGTSNSGSGNNNSGGDGEMTEEEMIAEAIARSLREN